MLPLPVYKINVAFVVRLGFAARTRARVLSRRRVHRENKRKRTALAR